jgi:hypothetical protein
MANVIWSPVVCGFEATPANSTILYQEIFIKIIRMAFVATVIGFVEFQNEERQFCKLFYVTDSEKRNYLRPSLLCFYDCALSVNVFSVE